MEPIDEFEPDANSFTSSAIPPNEPVYVSPAQLHQICDRINDDKDTVVQSVAEQKVLYCIVSKELYSASLRITIQKRSQHENPGGKETSLKNERPERKN